MEPEDVEIIIRHLAAAIAQQGAINDDLRGFNRHQLALNERLTAAIEHLAITQTRIEALLARLIAYGDNGRDA